MSITIKYTNRFDNIISLNQTESLESYKKKTYYDNDLKIDEFYYKIRGNNCKRTTYYLDSSEDKNSIIEEFCNITNRHTCTVFYNKQTDGGNTLWDREDYSDEGILKIKGKNCYDANMRVILILNYILGTSEIASAYKYAYLNSETDILFEFKYRNTGELFDIYDVNNNFDNIKPIYIEDFLSDPDIQSLFPWELNPYYHNLFPLLPETPIV